MSHYSGHNSYSILIVLVVFATFSLRQVVWVDGSLALAPSNNLKSTAARSPLRDLESFLSRDPFEIALLCHLYLPSKLLEGTSFTTILEELSAPFRLEDWQVSVAIGNDSLKERLLKRLLEKSPNSRLKKSTEILESSLFQSSSRFQILGSGEAGGKVLLMDLLLVVGISESVAQMVKETYGRVNKDARHEQEMNQNQEGNVLLPGERQYDAANPIPVKLDPPSWREVQLDNLFWKFRYVRSPKDSSWVLEIIYTQDGKDVVIQGEEVYRWVRKNIWIAGLGKTIFRDDEIVGAQIGDDFIVNPSGWIEDRRVVKAVLTFVQSKLGGRTLPKPFLRGAPAAPKLQEWIVEFLASGHFWSWDPPRIPQQIPKQNQQEAMRRYWMEFNHWRSISNRNDRVQKAL